MRGSSIATRNSYEQQACRFTNNIAEGSGSTHSKEFIQFLNIARRSLFEDASMLLAFETMSLFDSKIVDELLADCDALSRKVTNFSRTLRS